MKVKQRDLKNNFFLLKDRLNALYLNTHFLESKSGSFFNVLFLGHVFCDFHISTAFLVRVWFYSKACSCVLFVFSGIYPYRSQVSGLRLLMLQCMTDLSVDVLKITKHPNEAAIKVRWRIKGIPKIRKLVPYIGRRVKVDADGFRYTAWTFSAYFILVSSI